ncbi:glycoside hydrolase family 3 protein, partial [Mycoplasma marinum]
MKNLEETCLIGWHASNIYNQLGDYTPFKDLKKTLSIKDVFQIDYHEGTHMRNMEIDKIKEAAIFAKKYKNTILILGTSSARSFGTAFNKNGEVLIEKEGILNMDCGEGADVADIRISKPQIELFNAIKAQGVNVISVINSGRALGIESIVRESKAIIQMFYAGSEGSVALINTILGKNNPSGKLPISLPRNSNQLPVYYWLPEANEYIDEKAKPLFSFGDGLSYSQIKQEIVGVTSSSLKKHILKVKIINKSKED